MTGVQTCALPIFPGEEAYDVRIGGGVLANLGAHLRKLPVFAESDRALVVTDENVAPLYRADAKEALAQAGFRSRSIACALSIVP